MKKVVAYMGNPLVAAFVGGLYRFANEEQAAKLLARVNRQFILSKEQDESAGPMSVRLWVKGYGLTPEEEEQGYLGHYAQVRMMQTKNGRYTFISEKIEADLKRHPQRKRPPQRHPDWGHPVLRAVRKKKRFDDLEAARRELLTIHEAFPEISIPGNDTMNIIIYSRTKPGQPPVKKFFLRIKAMEDGNGYFIDTKEHIPADQRKKAMPRSREVTEGEEVVKGQFTALVELRRKKKPPIRAPKRDGADRPEPDAETGT